MVSPDELIPPLSELALMLEQWAGDTDDRVWNIANVTNELIEELEGGIVTRKEIYRAVAHKCKGRKVNTIRRWAEVAADFPKDTQDRYKDLVSFEHFKASRRLFNMGLTPSVDYGLQWCLESSDNTGKPKTVGELINHFVPEFRENGLLGLWHRVKDDLYDNFLMVDNDTDRARLVEAWKVIEYILDKKPGM